MSDRVFPIQQSTPIPWELAQRAYDTYANLFGSSQSLERLAERGGFGLQEFACLFAGHYPHRDHRECILAADAVGRRLAALDAGTKQLRAERNEARSELEKTCRALNWSVADAKNASGRAESVMAAYKEAAAERDRLQAFKAWVHGWLDANDVPADPDPGKTSATGCRIGGRLEWLKARQAV